MQKIILFFILIFITVSVKAQTEKTENNIVAQKFETFYNAEKFDSIFEMFSFEMRKYLPKEKANEFFNNTQQQVGKIVTREFINQKLAVSKYKTTFEHATLTLIISVDSTPKITGFLIKEFTDTSLPKITRNTTKLKLPFNGEWIVVWGGDTKELNYHVESNAQKNAFDILIFGENGKSYKNDGTANEDYYAFGKEITAPCDGEVVISLDDMINNKPTYMETKRAEGNNVVIKTDAGEFLLFAHFKQNSIKVKQGQHVKQGEVLGLCGNSGHSSEPHLHFHIQNAKQRDGATGVKCYFDKIIVNGQLKKDYSPIRFERIKNE